MKLLFLILILAYFAQPNPNPCYQQCDAIALNNPNGLYMSYNGHNDPSSVAIRCKCASCDRKDKAGCYQHCHIWNRCGY